MTFTKDKESLPKIKILYNRRALILESKTEASTLVVSDLHIGFEEKFRASGVNLKPDIDSLVNEINSILDEYSIRSLLINGDVKSGTDRISSYEWENVPKFFEKISSNCKIALIPGNHDGGIEHLIPQRVELLNSSGTIIQGNLVMHGHTNPLPKFSNCERLIIGHVHPIFQKSGSPLSGQPLWIFLQVPRKDVFKEALTENPKDLELIIMPSFNPGLVTSGVALDSARQERKIAPILRHLKQVEKGMIFTIDGELIGDETMIDHAL
ncbi:MAG: metallophosphoesterase [Nitrososphaerales archaeon]